jgi:NADPH:quinone reductase-like Zn-dependent oxidoreductase
VKSYVLVTGSRSLDDLRLIEKPRPQPAAGQLLVRMRAASLNYRDQLVATGGYFGGSVTRDTVPLSDGAGDVVEVGGGVTRFKPGDRVAGTFFLGWVDGPPSGPRAARGAPADGVLTEYALLDEADTVAIPKSLSFEEAATLPCAGVTAWNALIETSRIKPGDTVLVLGSGGVSMFALQFARAAGARVFMTSSSDDKLARGRALGAAEGINYKRTPDWEKEVLNLTGNRGVDVVVEVGGPGTLARSMQAVAFAGKITLIGVLAGLQGETNPHPIMRKGASMHGIFVGNRSMFERMNTAIEANGIKPVVDRVFAFEQAADAYRYQQSGAHFGKVVIRI